MNTMLINQFHVKPGKKESFDQWQKELSASAAQFPGFISQIIRAPIPPVQYDWILIQNFSSLDAAKKWLQSFNRQTLITQALPMLIGIDNIYLMQNSEQDQHNVTAAVTTKISPSNEQKFFNWQVRIAPLQSKFTGFIGCKSEKTKPDSNDWITIITFDSEKNLDAWLKSPDRLKMIDELSSITKYSHVEKIYSGFDFWFKQTKDSKRFIWKENMLVLLTLYPVVFLLGFIQNPLVRRGAPFWLTLFFSNAISTIILGSLTVPWLMKHFNWWIHPSYEQEKKYTLLGTFIVLLLYVVSLVIGWSLSGYL